MKLFLPAILLMAGSASATIFTDAWFNRGSQFSNPASLGANGTANIHYAVVTSPPQFGNLVGPVSWSSSSSTTYGSFGASLQISTGGASILPFQVNPGAPLDPIFVGRISTGFNDTWTLLTGAPIGSRGLLTLTYQLTGSTTRVGANASSSVRLIGTAGVLDSGSTSINGEGLYTLNVPMFVGTPQAMSIFLELRGQTMAFNQLVNLAYSNTAVLTALAFTPEGSTATTPFTLQTASGAPIFTELAGGGEVPEPATFAAASLGLAVIALLRRRRP